MTLDKIAEKLDLALESPGVRIDAKVTGGYASDMLSCVMAKARKGNLWVTLQAHPNIVAVASLLELAGIIITEGTRPDPVTIQKAQEEGIPIFTTKLTTFAAVGELFKLGIRATD
jgi:hypothetical protein